MGGDFINTFIISQLFLFGCLAARPAYWPGIRRFMIPPVIAFFSLTRERCHSLDVTFLLSSSFCLFGGGFVAGHAGTISPIMDSYRAHKREVGRPLDVQLSWLADFRPNLWLATYFGSSIGLFVSLHRRGR